jgi:hypothetical protein
MRTEEKGKNAQKYLKTVFVFQANLCEGSRGAKTSEGSKENLSCENSFSIREVGLNQPSS